MSRDVASNADSKHVLLSGARIWERSCGPFSVCLLSPLSAQSLPVMRGRAHVGWK